MSNRSGMSPKVTGRATVEPDAAGILLAISRIGYQLQDALADIIDNSIDAEAKNLLVRFFRDGDRLTDIAIVDDGHGMSEETLAEAMRFGSRTKKGTSELGKYGMGLKSASLNHADTLIVATRQDGRVSARRWTAESIRAGWKLETLDPMGSAALMDRDWTVVTPSPSGTIVLWERIHRFQASSANAGRTFAALTKSITKHLGLVFHRFLEDARLQIFIDLQDVSGETGARIKVPPLNPFPTKSGGRGYPTEFHTQIGTYGDLTFRAHLWPANSGDDGYKLGGRVAQRQGFYFFRNDRLIQAGGWNGWRDDAEPHSSLARVEVNLPPSFDDAFAISVQKDGVDAPPGFADALEAARSGRTTLADYIRDAVDLYRSDGTGNRSAVPVVSGGLRVRLRKKMSAILKGGDDAKDTIGIDMEWTTLESDEVFRFVPGEHRVLLNEEFRRVVLDGRPLSSGDAPIFKTLVFLLLKDDLLKQRATRQMEEKHRLVNSLLLDAIGDAP